MKVRSSCWIPLRKMTGSLSRVLEASILCSTLLPLLTTSLWARDSLRSSVTRVRSVNSSDLSQVSIKSYEQI